MPSYLNRAQLLGYQIIEAVKTENGNELDNEERAALDKEVTQAFLHGLRPEIAMIISDYATLKDAGIAAIKLENKFKSQAELRLLDKASTSKPKVNYDVEVKPTSQKYTTPGNPSITCSYCNRPKHTYDQCRRRTNICGRCNTKGHFASDCTSRTVNVVQNMTEICQLCNTVGHIAKTCYKVKNLKEPKVCQYCDKPGHSALECFALHPDRANQFPKCKICNKIGHVEDKCRNKPKEQFQEKEQTLPVVELFSEERHQPVYVILKIMNKSPFIQVNLPTPAFMLFDSGGCPSLVKRSVLDKNHLINKNITLTLSGITSQTVETLGKVTIEIFKIPCEFHVVSNDFPIEFDGILGTSFLQKSKSTIDYSNKCILINNHKIPFANSIIRKHKIPARMRQMIEVKVINDIKTGLVSLTKVLPGVFYGNAVVENKNGIAYLFVINPTDQEVEIEPQTVELEEISLISQNSETQPIFTISTTNDERCNKVLELIDLDHLTDPFERHEIIELIKTTSDIFHLPSEPLTATHMVTHKIPTTDDEPVHVKQYRYPFAMKSEIESQIKKMHEDGLLKNLRVRTARHYGVYPRKQLMARLRNTESFLTSDV